MTESSSASLRRAVNGIMSTSKRRWTNCTSLAISLLTLGVPGMAHAGGAELPKTADSTGLFGPIRLGATIGIGAPEGLAAAVVLRSVHLGLGARTTYLPLVTVPGLDLEIARFSVSGEARVYPFGGAFFFGAVFGYARSLGAMPRTITVADADTPARATVFAACVFAGPELGLQFRIPLSSRPRALELTIGTDIGVGIPLWSSDPRATVSALGLTVPVAREAGAADTLRSVARAPVPWVGLLNVGVLL